MKATSNLFEAPVMRPASATYRCYRELALERPVLTIADSLCVGSFFL